MPDGQGARAEHEMILASLDHLWPWFVYRKEPPTLVDRQAVAARERAEAAAGTSAHYIVFAADRPVGKSWIEVSGPATARIGWWLRADATGHGYATEAVRAVAALAFERGVTRLEAHVDPDNVSSRALAERAGFVLEEIRQDGYDRWDGVRRPDCVYVLPGAGSEVGTS